MPPTQNPQPGQPVGQPLPGYQPPYQPAQPAQQPLQPYGQPLHVSQPAPQAPQQSGSPYDFFLEPQQQGGKKTPSVKGLSSFAKMLIGAGILFAIMGVLAVVLSAGSKNKDTGSTGLLGIASSQQEIIRVSGLGSKKLESQSLLNFSTTAIAATTSAQQAIIDLAGKNGISIDPKELALTKNDRIDKILDAAASASTYDETFQSTMVQLVADYQAKLQQTRTATVSAAAREVLDKDLAGAELLQQMLKQQ